jgi:putative ABC transport system permease protein
MIRVANERILNKLLFKSLKANKTRNVVAIVAIALTSLLFTALFTVGISVNYSMQQQTMRMVGGYAHGGFKYLTGEQTEQLKTHPSIKEYGTTLFLTFLEEKPFHKHHTEVRYADDTGAKMFFSYPEKGTMPKGERELATDTAVLDLLGIPHKIGEPVTLTYTLGKQEITDTFTLSGFWQADEAAQASQIWLSEKYVNTRLLDYEPEEKGLNNIGTWSLDIMFSNSSNIEEKLITIAEDNGYTVEDNTSDNSLAIGVNWAYTSSQLNNGDALLTIISMLCISLLILLTGYLIIFNIFQISIAGEIRYYGLIKTIGTTHKQIRRLIRRQGLILSGIGIPLGLVTGFFVGNQLTRLIMTQMSDPTSYVTFNPIIFIGAALFSLLTVAVSLRKPAKTAARVSPIEAVRYTEARAGKRKLKKVKGAAKISHMASENLKLNVKKTAIIIISLSLSVVLLNTTYMVSQGFDMNKYLSKFFVTDFIVGNADYFQSRFGGESQAVTEDTIQQINTQEGIIRAGRVYGRTFIATIGLEEEQFIKFNSQYPYSQEQLDDLLKDKDEEGKISTSISIYGMEELPLEQLTVLDGTLDKDKLKTGRYLLQLVFADDYGSPETEYALFHIGDKVKIHYSTDYEYSEEGELTEHNSLDYDYEIMATVLMPGAMSVRSYGRPQYAMSAETFVKDTGKAGTMIYMVDAEDSYTDSLETFLMNYTQTVESELDYESKSSYMQEFAGFRNMFLVVGSILSLIIGIVGILNFINAELTSIMTRRREFAMLQSIGMTGKQLKRMLVYEGLFYGVASICISFGLSILVGELSVKSMENILWFFSYRYNFLPIAILTPVFISLGIAIPLICYKMSTRKSIVERLREAE